MCIFDCFVLSNLDWNVFDFDFGSSLVFWCVYNIGNNNFVDLMNYVVVIEKVLGIKVLVEFFFL